MKADWQTVGALAVVFVTVVLLVVGRLRRRRTGGAGCPGCRPKTPVAGKTGGQTNKP